MLHYSPTWLRNHNIIKSNKNTKKRQIKTFYYFHLDLDFNDFTRIVESPIICYSESSYYKI